MLKRKTRKKHALTLQDLEQTSAAALVWLEVPAVLDVGILQVSRRKKPGFQYTSHDD